MERTRSPVQIMNADDTVEVTVVGREWLELVNLVRRAIPMLENDGVYSTGEKSQLAHHLSEAIAPEQRHKRTLRRTPSNGSCGDES